MGFVEYFTMVLLSMAPISEARGAIVYGLASGINPVVAYFTSVLFNILAIPILFLGLEISHLSQLARKLFGKRAARRIEKHSKKLERYGELALFVFVALPLPVTGAWMGTFIASLLSFNRRKSFLVISLGVLVSGLIVLTSYYGVAAAL